MNNTVNNRIAKQGRLSPPSIGLPDGGGESRSVFGRVDADPPRLSNTGALNTSVCIDYVRFTIKEGCTVDFICGRIGGNQQEAEWIGLPGASGYRLRRCLGGYVNVFYDGAPDQGVHVEISGKGCRDIEAWHGLKTEADWQRWVAGWLQDGARFTRFDVAFDDIGPNGVLDMGVIKQAWDDGNVTSRCKKARFLHEKAAGCGGELLSDTINFGSRSSGLSATVYNKAKEQLQEAGSHWLRVEMRGIGNKQGHALVKAFVAGGFARMAVALLSHLDFKEPGADSNKSRWETAAWWSAFIGSVEKAPLFGARVVRTVAQVREWVEKQVAPSLAVLFRADCGDLEPLLGVIGRGDARLRLRHQAMLAAVLGPGGQEAFPLGVGRVV
jgi:phage replication initiation protein